MNEVETNVFKASNSMSLSRHQRISGNPTRRRDISRLIKRKTSKFSCLVTKKESVHPHWLPGDDYLLINATIMVCNLAEVYHTVRFSVNYTQKEIEERWRSLLFDPHISSISLSAIENLPNILKVQLDRQIPFSSKEDNIIAQVNYIDVFVDGVPKSLSASDLNHSIFTQLLRKHPHVFYAGRDALDLYRQWYRFQSCHCIPERSNSKSDFAPGKGGDSTKEENHSIDPDSLKNVHSMSNSPLGGNSESFTDTELLLEETVSSALASGYNKLTESSTVSRRQRMLGQSSYHGFQGLITQTVLEALARDPTNLSNKIASHQATHNVLSYALPETGTRINTVTTSSDSGHSSSCTHPELKTNHSATVSGSFDQSPFAVSQSSGRLTPQDSLPSKSNSNIVTPSFELRRRFELHRRRGRLWARLRRTKEEAKRWTHLVGVYFATGIELYDPQPIYPNLATLTGCKTRYLIKEKEVVFGRSTSSTHQPHLDLSKEGNTARISRLHGRIRLLPDGSFWLTNFSVHAIFVDGNPILRGEEVELKDGATICISSFTFRFDINSSYVKWLCTETQARNTIDTDSEHKVSLTRPQTGRYSEYLDRSC